VRRRRRGARAGPRARATATSSAARRTAGEAVTRSIAGELAELDAAVLVGLEGGDDVEGDRDVLEGEGDRPPAARLAGLAEQVEDVALRGGGEVQGLGVAERGGSGRSRRVTSSTRSRVCWVEATRTGRARRRRSSAASSGMCSSTRVSASSRRLHRLGLRGGGAGAVGDGDVDARVVDEGDGAGQPARVSCGRSSSARGLAGDQRLALEVEAGAEVIALGGVLEGLELGDLAVDQQHAGARRRGREGDRDRAVVARGVLAAAEPQAGVRERMRRRSSSTRTVGPAAPTRTAVAQAALADQGAARLAVADQLDDVGAGARAAGQGDALADAADRRGVAAEDLLVAGDHAVEVDRGVDLGAARQEVGDGSMRKVLTTSCATFLTSTSSRPAASAATRVGLSDGELEVDALAQRGEAGRAEQGGPALGAGGAGEQARGGEQLGEPVGAQHSAKASPSSSVTQEVLEVLADQRLVVGTAVRPAACAASTPGATRCSVGTPCRRSLRP
jgi:hypothetical protein